MSLPVNHQNLFQLLQQANKNPVFQKESGQNYIVLNINNQEVIVFFVILRDASLLQIIAYFPFSYMENKLGDLSRLLHLLNKEIDMPGFCIDEMEKLIFYRIVIPCIDKTVDPNLILSYLNTIQAAFDNFYGTIGVIANGSMTFDALLEEGKNALNKNRNG